MKEGLGFELRRQLLHAGGGILLAYLLLVLGRTNFLAVAIILMVVIGLSIFYIQEHLRSKLAAIIGRFERKESPIFNDAFMFLVGTVVAAFLYPETIAFYAIIILGIADAFAPMVGVAIGKSKIPWNKGKTYEGSLAFLIPAVAILFYAEPLLSAIVIGVLLTAVESLPVVNDNLTLPIAAGALMLFI